MNASHKSPEEMCKIMHSLERIQRAAPSPLFYARLLNKVDSRATSKWEVISDFLSKPIIATFIVFLIIAIDIVIIFMQQSKNESIIKESIVAQYQEYSNISNNFYDAIDENDVKGISK